MDVQRDLEQPLQSGDHSSRRNRCCGRSMGCCSYYTRETMARVRKVSSFVGPLVAAKVRRWTGAPLGDTDRLLARNAAFQQASGYFRVANRGMHGPARRLFCADWFHSLLSLPCSVITAVVFFVYIVAIFVFAAAYFWCSESCAIGAETFLDAYYFSLETMMTIGYGVSDEFFNGCWQALVLIVLQSLFGLFLDALCFGFIYTRIANPANRASTVCFTDKAVIREIAGHFYFMCQAVEMRKHNLVESSVRCYAIRTLPSARADRGAQALYTQQCTMRLQQPDDQLDSSVFLALPCVFVHRIDRFSPLHPDFDAIQVQDPGLRAGLSGSAVGIGGNIDLRQRRAGTSLSATGQIRKDTYRFPGKLRPLVISRPTLPVTLSISSVHVIRHLPALC